MSIIIYCLNKRITKGTSSNPGLIPRTLDILFESLKDNLETKKGIYQFKPEKFNEISSLSDQELNHELNYKEQILKMSNFKVIVLFCILI